jgi:hypothetical protein
VVTEGVVTALTATPSGRRSTISDASQFDGRRCFRDDDDLRAAQRFIE